MEQPVMDPGREVLDLLRDIQTNLQKMDEQLMRIHGLSHSEYRLLALCPAEIHCTCKALSRHLDLSVSRTSRILDRMVRHRLMERRCDQQDRRQCRIRLSKRGSEIQKKIQRQKEDLRLRLHSVCPLPELKRLVKNLRDINGISRVVTRKAT